MVETSPNPKRQKSPLREFVRWIQHTRAKQYPEDPAHGNFGPYETFVYQLTQIFLDSGLPAFEAAVSQLTLNQST